MKPLWLSIEKYHYSRTRIWSTQHPRNVSKDNKDYVGYNSETEKASRYFKQVTDCPEIGRNLQYVK